ncbi:TspO/MBR family protein [Nocardiopsis coralliicola]
MARPDREPERTGAAGAARARGPGAAPVRSASAQGAGAAVIAVCVVAAAVIGGAAASDAGAVYGALERPAWAPPQWLFGPAWTVLYVLMAVACWLVWRRTGARGALVLFAVQLALNAAWTPLFFAAGLRGIAFAEICVLIAVLAATIAAFARHSRTAALLLAPYLLWTLYAAALNAEVWRLNG